MEALLKLGIDWQSIIVYILNFGILFFLIAKFAVPPLLKALDERRNTIANSVKEANLLKDEFQRKIAEMEEEKKSAHLKFMEEMENMKKFSEEERAKSLKEIEDFRTKLMDSAQAEITQRKTEILAEAEKETLELIKKVVLYIVQNKIPEDIVKESVQDAWSQYTK